MDGAERERADPEARLAEIPDPEPVAIHPGLSGICARRITHLVAALNDAKTKLEAAALLRGLIGEFVLVAGCVVLAGMFGTGPSPARLSSSVSRARARDRAFRGTGG
ncbi:hypothetical protein C8J29_1091, partial [Cereibacter johrii]